LDCFALDHLPLIFDPVNRWTVRVAKNHAKKDCVQPLTAHEHWHIDADFINIAGTFVFMAKLGEHKQTADSTQWRRTVQNANLT
jgi:hypothetical protein